VYGIGSGVLARSASRIQRRTMLALRPLSSAIRETDTFGWRHCATISALKAGEK
jgi:hypothetical protein